MVYAVKPSPKFHADEIMENEGDPTKLKFVSTPVHTGDGIT